MKRTVIALLLICVLLFTGCGGAAKSAEAQAAPAEPAAADMNSYAEEAVEMEAPAMEMKATAAGGIANRESGGSAAGEMQAEKIIYSANAMIESVDYEATVQGVYDMVERFGGFVQSSSISGSDYYSAARGRHSLRYASFTVRIPSENFETLTSSLSELGNVPYCNTYSENVSAQYYDVQSRLTAYRTQEARLLEMLEIAETVEDLLAIQQQLTEVQYEIDSLQSTLTNYDRRISYSTVDIEVQEVEEYTEQPVVQLTYWQKMGRGFTRSLENVGEFFTDALLWFVSNLPALITWAIAIVAVVFVGKRIKIKRGGRLFKRRSRDE